MARGKVRYRGLSRQEKPACINMTSAAHTRIQATSINWLVVDISTDSSPNHSERVFDYILARVRVLTPVSSSEHRRQGIITPARRKFPEIYEMVRPLPRTGMISGLGRRWKDIQGNLERLGRTLAGQLFDQGGLQKPHGRHVCLDIFEKTIRS